MRQGVESWHQQHTQVSQEHAQGRSDDLSDNIKLLSYALSHW